MNIRSTVFSTFSCLGVAVIMVMASISLASAKHIGYPETFSFEVSNISHVDGELAKMVAIFDKAVPPLTTPDVAPVGRTVADTLFETHNQPGQNWRDSTTVYRHIDPGRRAA